MLRLLILAFIASCVPGQKTTVASGGGAVNANAPSRWPLNAFPKTVQISNNFTAGEITELLDANDSWDSAVSTNFFTNPAATNIANVVSNKAHVADLDSLLDSEFGIYKATTWHPELPVSALAVTQLFGIRHGTGTASEYVEIVEADVLVNFNFPFTPVHPAGYDLFSVTLHEMGHFLGLYHVYNSALDSVMFTTIGSGVAFTGPGSHDISTLRNRYQLSLTAGGAGATRQAVEAPSTPQDVLNSGRGVRVIIELHADGQCVHREDGRELARHTVDLSRRR